MNISFWCHRNRILAQSKKTYLCNSRKIAVRHRNAVVFLVYLTILWKWFHILKQNTAFDYQPGDAFCVICPNSVSEVEELLHILGLSERGERFLCVKVKEGTKKKGKVWCAGHKQVFLSVLVVAGMHGFEHF